MTADPEDHEPVEHEGNQSCDDVGAHQRHQIALLAKEEQEPDEADEPHGGVDSTNHEERDTLVTDHPQEPARLPGHTSGSHHLGAHRTPRDSERNDPASGQNGGEDVPPRAQSLGRQQTPGAVTGIHPQGAIPATTEYIGLAVTIEVPRADDGGERVPSAADEPRLQPST